jgi:DNA-binding NtrC family response regulator
MNPPKILIVDDDQVALRNLRHILVKEGCEVATSLTGLRAMELLEEEEYDLVLTDLRMPMVDGMEILERTRHLYPDSEVIMITGYAKQDSAIEAIKAGAYNYLVKPYKLDEFRKVVREALENRKLKLEKR